MALREVCSWNYVRVKREIFEVCILIGSVSLVADGFQGEVRFINFVYYIKDL